MSSGKRISVLVFCVSPVKELYLSPIEHYEPDLIYALVDPGNGKTEKFQRDQYNSLKNSFKCQEIHDLNVDTRCYNEILATLVDLKKDLGSRFGDGLDLFVNISSGTNEYAAAAMFASMLPEPSTAFRVDVSDSRLSYEEISGIFGTLSDSLDFSEPEKYLVQTQQNPDEEMAAFLSIMKELLTISRSPRRSDIIDELKTRGFWSYNPRRKTNNGRADLEDKENMYLKRHYMEPALKKGWLECPCRNVFRLTELGRSYISIYGESGLDTQPRPNDILCCCEAPSISESDINSEQVFYKKTILKHEIAEDFPEELSPNMVHMGHDRPTDNDSTVSFKHKGQVYRFHISME